MIAFASSHFVARFFSACPISVPKYHFSKLTHFCSYHSIAAAPITQTRLRLTV